MDNIYTVKLTVVWARSPKDTQIWECTQEFNQMLYEAHTQGLLDLGKEESPDGLIVSRNIKDRATAEEWKTKMENLVSKYGGADSHPIVSYTIEDII